MHRVLFGGLALLLAGCAAAPVALAPPGQDAAGKQFNPPPPGMDALYFYNPMSSGPVINVGAGAMVVGQVGPMTWMRVELGAGWHAMRCITSNSVNPSSITLAPGDIRFVDVEMPPGAPVCTIPEAPTEVGRAAVLAGSRALQQQ